jgi:CTP:molybdopterin cytidylyltransferase MocA
MTNAIVLAGGRLERRFAGAEGVDVKALLTVEGETLLAKAVRALRESGAVAGIAVVGPSELQDLAAALGSDWFVPERGSGSDNIIAGLQAAGEGEQVLISGSDMPFVLPQDVADVDRLAPADADLCYAIVERQEFAAMFPVGHRVFIPLRDGAFVGGGIIKATTEGLRAIEPDLRRVFEARKSPVAMARLFGTGILLRALLSLISRGRLGPSSDDLRRKMQEITGRRGAVVRGCSPRVAFDIDTEDDWRLACEIAARGRGGTAALA